MSAETFPEWTHGLQEYLFERLEGDASKEWHVQFADAASKVADWEKAYHLTMIAILNVVLPHDTSEGAVVQRIIDLHRNYAEASVRDWFAARWAARWVAGDAAGDARWAARSAARFAAGDAAGDAANIAIRDGFLAACEASQ